MDLMLLYLPADCPFTLSCLRWEAWDTLIFCCGRVTGHAGILLDAALGSWNTLLTWLIRHSFPPPPVCFLGVLHFLDQVPKSLLPAPRHGGMPHKRTIFFSGAFWLFSQSAPSRAACSSRISLSLAQRASSPPRLFSSLPGGFLKPHAHLKLPKRGRHASTSVSSSHDIYKEGLGSQIFSLSTQEGCCPFLLNPWGKGIG